MLRFFFWFSLFGAACGVISIGLDHSLRNTAFNGFFVCLNLWNARNFYGRPNG